MLRSWIEDIPLQSSYLSFSLKIFFLLMFFQVSLHSWRLPVLELAIFIAIILEVFCLLLRTKRGWLVQSHPVVFLPKLGLEITVFHFLVISKQREKGLIASGEDVNRLSKGRISSDRKRTKRNDRRRRTKRKTKKIRVWNGK